MKLQGEKINIIVTSTNPAKLRAVEEAFGEFFEDIKVVGQKVDSGVADTPLSEEETYQGAENRMEGLSITAVNIDYQVAIESGIYEFHDKGYIFTLVMIKHQGQVSIGKSISYPLPFSISEKLKEGEDLSVLAAVMSGDEDIRSKGGFVGYLSKGNIDRTSLTKDAVICALFPFINEDIYK